MNEHKNIVLEAPEVEELARGRILVVDDENGPRQSLRMLLNEDYDVTLSTHVEEALGILENETFDIIISDIRMPKKTGIDLLREVKNLYPEIEVIMLTGYGQLNTAMQAIDWGAFAYLEKPFDNEEMLAKVHACMKRRREEDNRRAMEYLALEANRFETLGELISGTLHDLGTPLSVIGSHLELLQLKPERDDLPERLDTMRSQLQHCNELVRSTMNFLRQNPEHRYGHFSLNAVVEHCLLVATPFLRKRKVEEVLELDKSLKPCLGDIVLVRQAVLNLMYNAAQALEEMEGPRQIAVKSWNEAEHIVLTVQDTGPGIPMEARKNIFNTLFTTKGLKGTGLGLTVVGNVMQRHGGEVRLCDTEEGACFELRFPRQQ